MEGTPEAAAAPASDGHDSRRLWLAVTASLAAGSVAWFVGRLMLEAGGLGTKDWDAVWALTGISFIFAFAPIPGVTTALLLGLRHDWRLGAWAVLGASLASVAAAGLLLALGRAGRSYLERKAQSKPWRRKVLAFSQNAAKRWTYGAIVLLLIPQFIPRAIVLYAAIVARLQTAPFLASVFVGVALRNIVMLLGFSLIP